MNKPMTEEEKAYAKAFGEEPREEDPSEAGAPEGSSGSEASGVTLGGEDGATGEGGGQEEDGAATAAEASPPQAQQAQSKELSAQALRSWEGRLKAKEAELSAAAAALEEVRKAGSAQGGGSTAPATLANGGAVEPGKTEGSDPEASEEFEGIKRDALALAEDPARFREAIANMVSDYGRDFVVSIIAALSPMVDAKACKYVDEMNGSLESLVREVIDGFSSMHRDRIASHHEDFESVVNGEEFAEWLNAMKPEEKAKVEEVLNGGSASQVVKILSQFKDSLKKPEEVTPPARTPDDEMRDKWDEDAASAVRSRSPIKLPSPRAPLSEEDEYRAAFDRS